MKKNMILILLFVVGAVCNAQKLDGSWKGQLTGPNGEMELVFTFKIDSASLSGTVVSPMGELQIENGKVDGDKFSFDVNVGGQVINHTAELKGDIVKMSIPMMDHPMELSRVEEKSKIDGKWIGKASGPQGEFELTFTFKVEGDSLLGKNSSAMGDFDFTNGKVNGKEFSFDVEMGEMIISHKCTYLDDDSIDMIANVMGQDMVMKLTRGEE